jgi:preprotein translocase subunit SecA
MNEQRKLIYSERLNVLRGENVHEQIKKYIPDYVAKVVGETVNTEAMPEQWDEEALNFALQNKVYPDECTFEITRERLEKWDYEFAIEKISKEVAKAYDEKIENIKNETRGQVDYYQVERNELLRAVDKNWIDHIDAMDQLRKGIGLRGYAQQDPVIAYKQEGHEMFEEMIDRIQTTTVSRLLKGRIIKITPPVQRPIPVQRVSAQNAPVSNQPAQAPVSNQPAQAPQAPQTNTSVKPDADGDFVPKGTVIHRPKKAEGAVVDDNSPCPCGSGKLYKDCCKFKDTHK